MEKITSNPTATLYKINKYVKILFKLDIHQIFVSVWTDALTAIIQIKMFLDRQALRQHFLNEIREKHYVNWYLQLQSPDIYWSLTTCKYVKMGLYLFCDLLKCPFG